MDHVRAAFRLSVSLREAMSHVHLRHPFPTFMVRP
ncbi:hypothetical protein CLV79_105155 [Limimaricola soesokkakensis]|uniref:Uncharacterized protein n=1 Tax=Limimaricola soesokkakensis TaxID=1343159 RepID=A0A1X6ZAM3_9RHOB|nr:hypothetical protein CLV79_105155 [Limimaricola soesokkakensis]SLN45731.1 hypothetical protein LOS8367_02017 [Limimaricola soesokkakensis]